MDQDNGRFVGGFGGLLVDVVVLHTVYCSTDMIE